MSMEFKINKYKPDIADQIIEQWFYTEGSEGWVKHRLVLESSIPYNHISIYDENDNRELSMTLSESQTTMILSALMCGKKGVTVEDMHMGTASGFLDVNYHISVIPEDYECCVHIWDTMMEEFGYDKTLIKFTIPESELASIIVALKWSMIYYAEYTDIWEEREKLRREVLKSD